MPKDPICYIPPFIVEPMPFMMSPQSQAVQWGITALGIPKAWIETKGEGIKVAVLDTGIAQNHPDLKDAIVATKDFTSSPNGVEDVHGHGTHVAGIVGARDNASYVVGVAPLCQLIIGKVLGDSGSGLSSWTSAGVKWAISQGADIISMSFGSSTLSSMMSEAVAEAIASNVVVVAAAGNSGTQGTMYPASIREVISVGASTSQGNLAIYSSRGKVDIVAPGSGIISTTAPNSIGSKSGTSMACPFVSGVCALFLAKERIPNLEVKQRLLETCDDRGVAGVDTEWGWGLIDPSEFVGYPIDPKPTVVELFKSDLAASGINKMKARGINKILVDIRPDATTGAEGTNVVKLLAKNFSAAGLEKLNAARLNRFMININKDG